MWAAGPGSVGAGLCTDIGDLVRAQAQILDGRVDLEGVGQRLGVAATTSPQSGWTGSLAKEPWARSTLLAAAALILAPILALALVPVLLLVLVLALMLALEC